MEYINLLIGNYTSYMDSIFKGNEFLIGLLTTGLVGYVLFFIKGVPNIIKNLLDKHLTTVVSVSSEHEAYHNIINNIGKEGIVEQSRFLSISNGIWGSEAPYLSFGNGYQIIFIFNKLCLLNVEQIDKAGSDRLLYKITFKTFGRSHNFAKKLLELGKPPKNIFEEKTMIYTAGVENSTIYQTKEKIENRIFVPEERELLKNIKDFIANEEFYKSKNLPYKLGILLYGSPGTGKTSCIRSIAGEIGYNICVLNKFSDFKKIERFEKTIILIDEIDSVISKRVGDSKKSSQNQIELKNSNEIVEDKCEKTSDSEILTERYINTTVSDALKEMDGIRVTDGTIIIGTTNFPDAIDDAFKRHGRFGKEIQFQFVTDEVFKNAIIKYYDLSESVANKLLKNRKIKDEISISQLQGKFCEFVDLETFIEHFTLKG